MPKSITFHYNQAYRLARAKIIRLVFTILSNNSHLKEFYMAMGTYYFVDKNGENITCTESYMTAGYEYRWQISRRYFTALVNHITDWDQYLKLTGEPLHIIKNEDGEIHIDKNY